MQGTAKLRHKHTRGSQNRQREKTFLDDMSQDGQRRRRTARRDISGKLIPTLLNTWLLPDSNVRNPLFNLIGIFHKEWIGLKKIVFKPLYIFSAHS